MSSPIPDWVQGATQYVLGAKIAPLRGSDRWGLPNPYGSSASSYEPNTQVYTPGTDPLMRGSSMQVEGVDKVDEAANKAAQDAANKALNEAQNGPATGGSPVIGGKPGSVGAFIAALKSQQGVPYVWGGSNPSSGFDCSGLVSWAFNAAGIPMPRYTSQSFATMGQEVPAEQARPGDVMVWWEGDDVGYGHVGVYLGNGQMIAAPQSGDVVRVQQVWGNPVYRRIINDPSFGTAAMPGGLTQPSYGGVSFQQAFRDHPVAPPMSTMVNTDPYMGGSQGGGMRAM